MNAIVLPDIDKTTIDELRKRMPNLSTIELPKMELPKMDKVSKTADQTIDRLLGRKKAPVWPWIAAGIGLVAVIGAVAAYFAFWRRPSWDTPSEPWSAPAGDTLGSTGTGSTSMGDDSSTFERSTGGQGLTAAESSLSSTNPYSTEEV
jgi:hypothetical protein